jgi:uncharacterized protein (TIGR00255 family)
MTGFAERETVVTLDGGSWQARWDLRSVNGKGLDLRLRLPEGLASLETPLRQALGARLSRGTVTLSLRLSRIGRDGPGFAAADLDRLLGQIAAVTARAEAAGVALRAPTALDLLHERGILDETGGPDAAAGPELVAALMADIPALLDAFDEGRAREGAALGRVLGEQVSRIATLTTEARRIAEARGPKQAERLRGGVEALMEAAGAAPDPERLAQELALLLVKADVTEELDRLEAHVAAARALLSEAGAVGRKLDFLSQEFNREANTLCAKSGDPALTRLGLDLKHVVDQFREQIQNLE